MQERGDINPGGNIFNSSCKICNTVPTVFLGVGQTRLEVLISLQEAVLLCMELNAEESKQRVREGRKGKSGEEGRGGSRKMYSQFKVRLG